MLSGQQIAWYLGSETSDLAIVPLPDGSRLARAGGASVDLRLGRWFLNLRYRNTSVLDVAEKSKSTRDLNLTRAYFVPFGESFVLHPGNFVLGATLEWVRLPANLGGYITGKSSWGRRGLIIETAAGVHPRFTGCLTLEIANVGEIPIRIRPGMRIAQLFLHGVDPGKRSRVSSTLAFRRRPTLGVIKEDKIATRLAKRL